MEAIVGSIVSKVVEYTVDPMKNILSYVCYHERKVENLKDQVENLKNAKERVMHSVDVAKGNGEEIEADVDKWLTDVNKKIDQDMKKVMQDQEKAKSKCFIGLCPNFWTRYKLSMTAEVEEKAVAKLLEKGKFDRVSYRPAPKRIMASYVKGFEAFESRTRVLNKIMEALEDDRINLIAVHGLPGVGKTTLVKEVARQGEEGNLFDSVVMAVVAQNPDIKKIQDQIADLLRLKFEEQSLDGRARRLSERLSKVKKVLVVLDNIWTKLDLEEIGIPFGDEHKGCKILLTLRDLNVLSNVIVAPKTFSIGILEEKEAWDLFKKMVGDSIESPELRSTAIKIVKKCAGLPIAITTVAGALRNKGLFAWKDALLQLQRPSSRNIGISADVYSPIELSYNQLESEELKQTFLLCSLLGHDAAVQDLLKYTLGLGLFHGVSTVEETRNRLLTVISNLKASCLLLDSYNNERFDMHDLISDVALAIASRDSHVFELKHEGTMKDWPDGETLKKCEAISLQNASIIELPDELNCPKLAFLFMGSKDSSVRVPPNFFRGMKILKVLDLTKIHFSSLPSSICLLTDLRTLCLDQCVLRNIAIIGELKSLEILSLLSSDIEILPKEIGQLTKLRLLDLNDCTKLKVIPPNVLASLSGLEELYMGNSFVQWEVEGHSNRQSNASLAELKLLSCLTTLYIHIPDAKIMPRDLFSEKLERFKIFIGDEWDGFDENEYSRTFKLKLTSIDHLDHGIKLLLNKTEDLFLDELKGVKFVLNELEDGEGFQHLKKLHIQNGMEVQYMINDNDAIGKMECLQLRSLTLQGLPQFISFCYESTTSISPHELALFGEKIMLPHLENLLLSSINIERIWHNQLSETFYCIHNLKTLIIEGCDNLKHLLSPSMARSLEHLNYFEITTCKCLREIIFTEDIREENNAVILFPRLNSLKIKDLANLIGFCSESHSIEFSSLKLLEIEHCPELKGFVYNSSMEKNHHFGVQALFNEKVAFPCLEKLTVSRLRNMKMIWHNQLSPNSFCKLEEMEVEYCNELLTIFTSNVLRTFQGLQTLKVSSCCALENIFELQSLNLEETHVVATQLRELCIFHLPKLKYVWNKDPQGTFTFQNLRVVIFWDCWSLKNVFPASVARVLPQLKDLTIDSCGVEEIVYREEVLEKADTFVFYQVSSLKFLNLPKLKCFYPGMHTTKWPNLKKLKAYHCKEVKMLNTEGLHAQEMNGDGRLESPIQPSLFWIEKVIPKLEELSLNSDDIAMICDTQIARSIFHEIRVLTVLCYHDESAIFPITFLERFYNLETLEVACCEFKELFFCGGEVSDETHLGILSRIRNLRLNGLNNLKYIWTQSSRLDHILPNLETLDVHNCGKVITLGSSSASFQNLMTLDLWQCKAMINLVTSSAAQCLVQLKEMRIRECISMEQIVGNEGDEATYDIIFGELTYLELQHLPNLTSFSQGNHMLKFPSLEQVIVNQCPNLKIFCHGILSTPKLKAIQLSNQDYKGRWVGCLNSTIQQLYKEKVGYREVEYLVLSEFSELLDIRNKNLQGILDFRKLKFLEVHDCDSLKFIFTPSMVFDLMQLRDIKVKNCTVTEQIIKICEAEESVKNLLFPLLESITLESCPELTTFCLGSKTLDFPSLKRIIVADCPKMVSFASASLGEQESEKIDGTIAKGHGKGVANVTFASFFNDKVLCPNLEYLQLSSINIQKIWHNQPPITSYVQNLKTIIVEGCDSLKYLFLSFMVKNFVQLNDLKIRNCKIVEEVVFVEASVEQEGMTEILFPKLEFLELTDLPKLARFCYGNHFEFPFVRTLWIGGCLVLKTFISNSLIGDDLHIAHNKEGINLEADALSLFDEKVAFPRLEDLRIIHVGNCRKIWHEQLSAHSFCELNFLMVKDCERLLSIFPLSMMGRIGKLEKLHTWSCNLLEEIIASHGINSGGSHSVPSTPSIASQ